MRQATCQSLINLYQASPFIFLTGDLGFMALEPLREVMGGHFVNAGIAEQNMVSVAAGISSAGLQAWCYSIAPFLYARAFEQIRNDVCLHNFDVKFIGNGGGYGYGSMGSTHHALEDYGALLTLQNMRAFIPAFADDLSMIIPRMSRIPHPAYLRLGRCEKPANFVLPEYAAWRKLLAGDGPVILVVGPVAGGIVNAFLNMDIKIRPEIWVLSELPLELNPPPGEFWGAVERSQHLIVIEEHVMQGSAGQMMAHRLLTSGIHLQRFEHIHAKGYPSGCYGSQAFHRKECGMHPEDILKRINDPRHCK